MDWYEKAKPWVHWEAEIEAVHAPVAKELLKRAGLVPGEAVVDIGCGSGKTTVLSAEAVGAAGTVLGVDIAPALTTRASERTADLPNVTIRTGDAETLEFHDWSADVVISLFGMMFFSDPKAAFANIGAVLKPGGRIIFVAWAGGKDNPWFSRPRKAMEHAIGDLPAPNPTAPGPLAFADVSRVTDMMKAAGLEQIHVDEVDTFLTPSRSSEDVAKMLFDIGPSGDLIRQKNLAADDAEAIANACRQEIARQFSGFEEGATLRVPAKVRFFSATKSWRRP